MRGKHCGSLAGIICIITGMMIVLSLVLPTGFWWFLLGSSLIAFGVYLNRRCC